nr:unnamed protein product [Callosobruchus analis]
MAKRHKKIKDIILNARIRCFCLTNSFFNFYIDGVVVIDDDYKDRKIFGQVVCSFRYGREEDEVMGLKFQKDLYLASEQVYPPPQKTATSTKLQERLKKKLGDSCYPFIFTLPPSAPASVTLQPGRLKI